MPAYSTRVHSTSSHVRRMLLSEAIGTALLLAIGLSFVIVDFGRGSPILRLLPGAGARRALTGFLFGCVGGAIAVSELGKTSGAHINPVVTLFFWAQKKMTGGLALGYALAQLAGAIVGTLPLLLWGRMGRGLGYGGTWPGVGVGAALATTGEMLTTFALLTGLMLFLGSRRLRPYTPALFPFLYAVLVYWEAPLSGTSTNPARSFGPNLISTHWQYWWVYWLGPGIGFLLAFSLHRLARLERWLRIEVAKIYHFDHDPSGIFHHMPRVRGG
jgi:aquaporin Z